MDDLEAMKLWRSQKKARRASNRAKSSELLTEAGIPFTIHNGGAHLIVAGEWDFWPGTGLWHHRAPAPKGTAARGRGVRDLIARIKP